MTEELKPCPFCGGQADYDQFSDLGDDWQVLCESRYCRGSIPIETGWADLQGAIKAWNTRTNSGAIGKAYREAYLLKGSLTTLLDDWLASDAFEALPPDEEA